MLGAPVVPEDDIAGPPSMAIGKGRLAGMGIDEVEQWLALLDRPAIEMIDHLVRNEEAFATGVGMGDHHRVHRASHARQLFLGGRLAPVENTRAAAEQGVEGPLPDRTRTRLKSSH